MWRALFIGWLAIALAEEAAKDTEGPGVAKRQTARGNTVVYGASPSQYTLQNPERGAQQQVSADYPQQSELYVISPGRKATPASALAYASDSPRRPQYIQLSALQLQAAQQLLQHQQLQQQGVQPQQVQQQVVQPQPQVSYEPEPSHGVLYRPRQQESKGQFAASAIIDSQLYPQAGSFERELAQLVAANRAQEQKYNAAAASSIRKQPQPQLQPQPQAQPQQYLKEVSRPVRPLSQRVQQVQYQPVQQVQPSQAAQQQVAQPVYRYVYQPEQLQQIQAASQQQYKQPEPQYIRQPQLQQYVQSLAPQPQPQSIPLRLREESDSSSPVSLRQGLSATRLAPTAAPVQPDPPSRSTIYVSQSTPLKKSSYSVPQQAEEEEKPVVRIPARNRPLTQDEFQSILQSGGYTATLVPSNDPNSPHQEYLLHPTAAQQPRQAYASEKEVTYLLPQAPQRAVKRRPVYSVQQA